MKDLYNIKATVEIFSGGKLVYTKCNLLTNNGAEYIADRILNNNITPISHLAIDDGAGTYTKTTTALNNEVYRQVISSSSSPGSATEYIINVPADQAVGVWTGLGLFNDAVAGTLTNAVNISYTHISGESVQVKWTIQVNN